MPDARAGDRWVLAMLPYTAGIWGANVVMIKIMAAHFEALHLAAIRTVVAFAFIALALLPAFWTAEAWAADPMPRVLMAVSGFLSTYRQALANLGTASARSPQVRPNA